MTRSYRPVKELEPTIFQKKAEGKSNREIREEYGLSKKQMSNLINRHNRRQKRIAAGFPIRGKGSPPKGYQKPEYEIKRLQMENELLRNFLSAVGRR